MKKRTSSLPVLVVVAVVALVLGSIGTAVAGPAITKKKVKAIATKVVKKKAPTLSVASAGNATNLNGQGAAAYQDNAAFVAVSHLSPIPVTADTSILGPASITVPAGRSLVRATGNVTMAGTGGNFIIYLVADAVCSGVAPSHSVFSGVPGVSGQISATVDFVFAAAPGTHTYRLCASTGGPENAYNRTLTLQTLAGGTTSVSARAGSSGGRDSLSLR